jgi:lysozyme family protein
MNTNWEACFKELIEHEGGYVNHPSDPGGRTNLGITQEVWEDWVDRAVNEAEMRGMSPEKVKPLYKDLYWDRIKGDKLPSGVDYVVFDAAVNSGCFRAAKWLQESVGAKTDGIIGEYTIGLVRLMEPGMLIEKYSSTRLEFLKGLLTWPTFGEGWKRRVEEVKATALSMV